MAHRLSQVFGAISRQAPAKQLAELVVGADTQSGPGIGRGTDALEHRNRRLLVCGEPAPFATPQHPGEVVLQHQPARRGQFHCDDRSRSLVCFDRRFDAGLLIAERIASEVRAEVGLGRCPCHGVSVARANRKRGAIGGYGLGDIERAKAPHAAEQRACQHQLGIAPTVAGLGPVQIGDCALAGPNCPFLVVRAVANEAEEIGQAFPALGCTPIFALWIELPGCRLKGGDGLFNVVRGYADRSRQEQVSKFEVERPCGWTGH